METYYHQRCNVIFAKFAKYYSRTENDGGMTIFFLKFHPIFAPNFREKISVPARDFGQKFFFSDSEWIFSMVVFGIVVAVTVAVTTGRRAGKKIHLFILWPIIPERKHVSFYDGRRNFFFHHFRKWIGNGKFPVHNVVRGKIYRGKTLCNFYYRRRHPNFHP